MKDERHIAIPAMLLAGFCYAIMLALGKQISQNVPVAQISFFRLFINLLIISYCIHRNQISFLGSQYILLLLRGSTGAIALGLSFYAAAHIPLVDMTILVKMSVIFTAIFATLWLKERLTIFMIAHMLLAFIAVALIIKPSWVIANAGGAAALGAAILIGFTGVLIRRLHQKEHPFTIIFYFCGVGVILYPAFFGSSFILPSTFEFLCLVILGAIGSIGQFGFTYAYRYGEASTIAPFIYSEVLFSALLGMLFFGEIPDALTIVGVCLAIYAGIAIARRKDVANQQKEQNTTLLS